MLEPITYRSIATTVVMTSLAFAQAPPSKTEVEIHAPYVSTPPGIVDAMLALAKTRNRDVVYDLGCGDGRIVIAAAKRYGARGVGVDIDPDRIREAKANARREGVEGLVQFEEQDAHDVDLRPATVVMVYLLPAINHKLRPKLQRELRPGARVVAHTFDLGSWKPTRTKQVAGAELYLWKIPGRL